MIPNDKEIYLRILSDVQFVSAIFDTILNETDSLGGKVLQERINVEREALRLDKERVERETKQRQLEIEQKKEYQSE